MSAAPLEPMGCKLAIKWHPVKSSISSQCNISFHSSNFAPACVRMHSASLSPMASLPVPMRLLNLVLLMLMTYSCSALPAEEFLSLPAVKAYGRRDSSVLTLDDTSGHAPTPRSHRKNDAPGFRLEMTRRPNGCAKLLQGSEPRSQHLACTLESSSRRQSMLAGGKATPGHLGSATDWKFPESEGIGEYLAPIYLGTPEPQKASVIIDTGSDLTWIQSQPCSSCYHQEDPIFDPSKSVTYKRVPCNTTYCDELLGGCSGSGDCAYSYFYGDGSQTQGYFSKESITVETTSGGKETIPDFEFGASVYSVGSFEAYLGEEGILGLGQGNDSFPSQLGSRFGNKFSTCFVDWGADSSVASSMYFGEAAVPEGDVMYTPILPNSVYPSFYFIRVVGISVGGTLLEIDPAVFEMDSQGNGGTIIDSGTTITFLQSQAYDKVYEAYISLVEYPLSKYSETGLPLCFDTTGVSSPTFPTMEIHLDGAHLRLPVNNTFFSGINEMCLTFVSANGFPFAILGNFQQHNFDVVYDLQNKRLGFTPTDCATI